MPPLFAVLNSFFFGVLGVGILIRLTVALTRRRAGRRAHAVRSALGPVMGAGAAASAARGWIPPRSMDATTFDRSTDTSGYGDRARGDLPDDFRDADPRP